MNFPTVTIPDPAAVGRWLDEQVPSSSNHNVSFIRGRFFTIHWLIGYPSIDAYGNTPDELLENLRKGIAACDPLAKLRKEWEAMGKPDLNDKPLA